MSIADRLASAQGRRVHDLNIALAGQIAKNRRASDVADLVTLTRTGSRPQKHDAIKVLYEIGKIRPELITPHLKIFAELLEGKDNRMIWGGLTAIAAITPLNTKLVHDHLAQIFWASERGSVIAKDQTLYILVALMADDDLEAKLAPILLDQIRFAAINQLPMYAELAKPALASNASAELKTVLAGRLTETMPDSKRRRIKKIIKALST